MSELFQLWRGLVPLARAFWVFALLGGTLANELATGVALSVIALGGATWIAVLIAIAPIPYLVLALVGVWRSANRSIGPRLWPDLARTVATLWFAALVAV